MQTEFNSQDKTSKTNKIVALQRLVRNECEGRRLARLADREQVLVNTGGLPARFSNTLLMTNTQLELDSTLAGWTANYSRASTEIDTPTGKHGDSERQ